jgi:hypothetical protein
VPYPKGPLNIQQQRSKSGPSEKDQNRNRDDEKHGRKIISEGLFLRGDVTIDHTG